MTRSFGHISRGRSGIGCRFLPVGVLAVLWIFTLQACVGNENGRDRKSAGITTTSTSTEGTSELKEAQDFIRRYSAAWASREPGVMAPLWHPDGELHHPVLSATIEGSLVSANNDNTKRVFPDLKWSLLDWAVHDDVVFLHWQNEATIGGERRVWNGVDRMELRDGRIVREDVYLDTVR